MNLTWKRQRSLLELQGLKNEEKYTKCWSQKKAGVSYLTFQQFHEDRATSPNIQTETHPCSEIQRLWTQKPGHMCLSTNAKRSYQNHFAIIQDELENPPAEDDSLFSSMSPVHRHHHQHLLLPLSCSFNSPVCFPGELGKVSSCSHVIRILWLTGLKHWRTGHGGYKTTEEWLPRKPEDGLGMLEGRMPWAVHGRAAVSFYSVSKGAPAFLSPLSPLTAVWLYHDHRSDP